MLLRQLCTWTPGVIPGDGFGGFPRKTLEQISKRTVGEIQRKFSGIVFLKQLERVPEEYLEKLQEKFHGKH